MKLRNKKGLVLGIVALSAVAITSVGFAAWIITAGAQSTAEGQIIVDSVTDQRLKVTGSSASNITFGGAANASTLVAEGGSLYGKQIWLVNSNKTESLTATVTFDIEPATDGENLPSSSLSGYTITYQLKALKEVASEWVEEDSNSDPYRKCAGDNLITSLETVLATKAQTATSETDTKISVSTTFTFAWGTAFGSKNPFEYYNLQDYSSSLADEAKTKLEEVEELENTRYQVTIDVKAN